jgi:hypothetical protein
VGHPDARAPWRFWGFEEITGFGREGLPRLAIVFERAEPPAPRSLRPVDTEERQVEARRQFARALIDLAEAVIAEGGPVDPPAPPQTVLGARLEAWGPVTPR